MKRNAKFVAICLAVVFVLAVMCGVLVACNKDKNKNGGEPGSITSIISNDELEHIVGYVATEGYKDGQSAEIDIQAIDLKEGLEDMLDMPYKESYGKTGMNMYIRVEKTGEEDSIARCSAYVLDGESQAKAFYDDLGAEAKAQTKLDGKYLISESAEGLFKNTILTATAPSQFSKTRMDFIKDGLKIGGAYTSLEMEISTNFIGKYDTEASSDEYMSYYIGSMDSNCEYYYGYYKLEEGETYTDEQVAEMLKNCTSDSFIDLTKEAGFMFQKTLARTGLFYDDTFVYIGEDTIEGLKVDYYNYDKNTSKDLVIPATVGEKNVIKAGIEYSNLVSVTLSEGILEMDSFGYNEELTTISLPKSIKRLCNYIPFSNCVKLTTIKYAGTTDEWNALVEANHLDINNTWCKYYGWDDETDEQVQKTLSFTVQCSNGNISYPTAA